MMTNSNLGKEIAKRGDTDYGRNKDQIRILSVVASQK